MKKIYLSFFFLFPLLLLSACFEDEPSHPVEPLGMFGGGYESGEAAPMMAIADSSRAAPRAMKMQASSLALDRSQFEGRYIAESHEMSLIVPKEALQARYNRDVQQAMSVGAEIVSSQITSGGYAYVNLRIVPEALPDYLDFISNGEGEVESHQVNATDKTAQTVDTEAKLKNQIALRDRLLKLLETKADTKVKDLLDIERELTRVQGQIDSFTAQRRRLSQQTDKASVNVSYRVPPRAIELEYHDIGNSLRYAWNGFLQSVSNMIAFTFKVLPWIPLWFLGGWLAVKVIRFALRKSVLSWRKVTFWKKKEQV